MERKNCWEIMACGRESGGKNAEELGVCPAAEPSQYDGVNKGTYSGRFCWAVAGSFCKGEPSGTIAMQLLDCLNCKFLQQVNEEEGRYFILSPRDIRSIPQT